MAETKILATIDRTDTEQLQISVSEYRGKSYFNLRIFYTTIIMLRVFLQHIGMNLCGVIMQIMKMGFVFNIKQLIVIL